MYSAHPLRGAGVERTRSDHIPEEANPGRGGAEPRRQRALDREANGGCSHGRVRRWREAPSLPYGERVCQPVPGHVRLRRGEVRLERPSPSSSPKCRREKRRAGGPLDGELPGVRSERGIGRVPDIGRNDQARNVAFERSDAVLERAPRPERDEDGVSEGSDRRYGVSEAKRPPVTGCLVDAGDGAGVAVRDPDATVSGSNLERSLSGLVARGNPSASIDLVELPGCLVGRPRVPVPHDDAVEVNRQWSRRDDAVRPRVDAPKTDAVRRDPEIAVTARDCRRTLYTNSRLDFARAGIDAQNDLVVVVRHPERACAPGNPGEPEVGIRRRELEPVDGSVLPRVYSNELLGAREPHAVAVREVPACIS